MNKYLIVVEWNGRKHVGGKSDSLAGARQIQARLVNYAENIHKHTRVGANCVVRVLTDAATPARARTRGTYLKSWR